MKKNILLYSFLATIFIIGSAEIESDHGQAGYTGSPNEATCTSCHSGAAINSGGGSVMITSNIPGNKYLLSHSYQVTVTVSQTGVSLFGFGMEALVNATKNNAGTLVVTNAAQTQILSRTVAGVSRKNMVHKFNAGIGTDTKSFIFNWTSPATNVGNVTFYAVGNAANANGSSSGDFIYSTSQAITPDPILSVSSLNANNSIQLFPNPATDYIHLQINNAEPCKVSAELYNLNGSYTYNVFDEYMEAGLTEKKIDLDSFLQKGIYILRLNRKDAVTYKKIIVQ